MKTGIELKNRKGKALGPSGRRLVALLLALVQCVSLTFAGAPLAYADDDANRDAVQTVKTEPASETDPEPESGAEPEEDTRRALEAVLDDQLLVTLYYDAAVAGIPDNAQLRIRVPVLPPVQTPAEDETAQDEQKAETPEQEEPADEIPDGIEQEQITLDPDTLYMSEQDREHFLSLAQRVIGLRDCDLLFSLDLFELSILADGKPVTPTAPVELEVGFLQADPSLEETFAAIHLEGDAAWEMKSQSYQVDGLCTLYLPEAELGLVAFSSCAWQQLHTQIEYLDVSLYAPAGALVEQLAVDVTAPEGQQVLDSFCYVAQSRAASYMTSIWADVKPLQEQDGEQELSLYALKGPALFYRLSGSASTDEPVYMGQADGVALVAPAAEEKDSVLYSSDVLSLVGDAPEGLVVNAVDVSDTFADVDLAAYFAEQSMAKRGAKSASVPKRYVLIGAYDISLLLDGKEYQPEEGKPILVSITDPAIGEGYELQLWHIHDDGSREKVDFTVDGDTMSFWADSFSVYAALYTVDFHWGEYTCHLGGEDSILLSALLHELNVTEIDIGDVTEVSFSDPELLQVEAQDGDWLLTSLKPFQTEETLSLALKNGETVTIAVDDAINVSNLNELTSALNNPANGATILLQDDISSDSALSISYWNNNAGYTIDLGGHTLTVGGDGLSISDSNTANILIQNGSLVSKLSVDTGGVTLGEGLTMTGDANVTGGGTLTVDGAAVDGNVSATDGSTLTLSSGSASGNVSVSNGGALNISGGTVGGDVSALDTSTTMTGGTVSGDMTITNQNAELSGGTVSGNVSMENASTTISGGTFGGTVSASGGSTTITGGAFENLPTDLLPQNLKILTITAGSASKSYDGKPLTCDTYEAEGLTEGDTIESITFAASQTEVGDCENIPTDVCIKRGEADVTAEYIVHYISGTLTVTQKTLTITADSASKRYDGAALTKETYTYTGLAEGDEIRSVTFSVTDAQGQPTEAMTGGEYVNVPSDAVVFDADGEDVTSSYVINYANGSLTVIQPQITITADSDSKTYDGEPLTKATYTCKDTLTGDPDGLYEGDKIQSVTVTGEQTNAGESDNVPSDAVIVDANGVDVTASYLITYVNGKLTVEPAPVTLTSISTCRNYTGSEQSVSGYTCSVPDLSFTGVSAGASGVGDPDGEEYPLTFTGVTLNETRDTTGNYVVTQTVEGRLLIATLLLTEEDGFIGNLASYKITINPHGLTLNGGTPVTVKDTLIESKKTKVNGVEVWNGYTSQSIDYSSVIPDPAAGVSFDYSGYTGTFVIPDATTVTVTYTARVLANAGTEATFGSSTVIGLPGDDALDEWGSVKLDRTETITPTGSDITGVGGKYTIKVYVYPEGHLETGLAGATFRLLDNNQRPIKKYSRDANGQLVRDSQDQIVLTEVTFTTGSDGFFTVELEEDRDGVSIHKNTVYYLEMIETPVAGSGTEADPYTYFQKDNTLYNFLITDNAEYSLGDSGIYTYFNGDVLKVRCYPESVGINVTVRFTGNFTPTDAQKDAVVFVLERENTATSGWDEAERHAYSEFDYGSLRFTKGAKGWEARDYGATYRIRVENAEVTGAYLDVNSVVSSQSSGQTISDETNEFLVDPDHEAYSFSLIFTLEYSNRTLTFYALDEESGALLPGMELSVFKAIGDQPTGITYTTAADGTTVLKRADSAQYQANVLYYVMETKAPTDYLLPDEPVKTYFYFSEGSILVPPGLPSGETALDLSKTYSTVAIANNCVETNIPVVIAWGLSGAGTWPSDPADTTRVFVDHILVSLYRTIDGVEESEAYRTVTLTAAKNFDNSVFHNLPVRITEDGVEKKVSYRLEETIYGGSDGTLDVTSHYAMSETVSGSGWHVLRNQEAVSVTVEKQWLDLNGSSVSDTSGLPSVQVDLYRTSVEGNTSESLTREDLQSFLNSNEAVLVRSGLKLTAEDGWTLEVPSLQATDKDKHPYYYFALEREASIPDNHEDLYTVTPASDDTLRTLSVANKKTPFTVVIQAPANAAKEYGEEEPDYTDVTQAHLSASVQGGGATVGDITFAGGEYSFTVTKDGVTQTIKFMLSRDGGESVGSYILTPYGSPSQGGYRVLYKTGMLTITHAPVVVTAEGKQKYYGDPDPDLAIVQGMKNGENAAELIHYEAYRDPGEDVEESPYNIYLSGQLIQGNYSVTYVNGTLSIIPARAFVKPQGASKQYGEDDPRFGIQVTGLKGSDMPSVINISSLTRDPGEDVGSYTIRVTGEEDQGNYIVTYGTDTMTIEPAELRVTVESEEIIYGDPQPEWDVWLDGLQRGDGSYTLTTEVNEGTTTYTYALPENKTITFTLSSNISADVGEYPITLSGEASQGNYTVSYVSGRLNIVRALLTVTADNIVRNVNDPDPVLTATVKGWRNGDDLDDDGQPIVPVTSESGEVTYTLRGGKTLVFTLQRVPGTAVGDYTITATGGAYQGNYEVEYESGIFSILSVYGIQVSQTIRDLVDASANPAFNYLAEVDLTGTGLSRLTGFDEHNQLRFTLGGDQPKVRTLQIPVGAKLTVSLVETNGDYKTSMTLDGDPYHSATNTCVIDNVDNFYYIGYEYDRICLPAVAMAAADKAEDPAEACSPTAYIAIPSGALTIDGSYVQRLKREAGYTLPTDKYYEFDHATLVSANGSVIARVKVLDYAQGKWVYKSESSAAFSNVPEGAELRLYYYPKYVCQIGAEKFYTLNAALSYMQEHEMTEATVEMLLDNFVMPESDTLTIPADTTITLTKAGAADFEGSGTTATISRSLGLTGNMFVNYGGLILDNIILDGIDVTNCDAMVSSSGTLTVTAKATLQNADGVNGGALAITGGTADINGGMITGNHATNGGAVHMSGGTLNINGGTFTGNSAASGGAVFMTGGSVNVTGGSVSGNSASYGGAFYTEGGSVSISEEGAVTGNTAAQSGGMLFATGGNLEITGGSVTDNIATNGNGGAVCYSGPGTVTVSGGEITGNKAENGKGGAIYQSSGTVTITGTIGASGKPNQAVNGSAIFVKAGIANFKAGATNEPACTIQHNVASDGGAVGVDANARLYFSGNITITENTNASGQACNVYLDQDSDEIINLPNPGLGKNASVGIYVADNVYSTRGYICCAFGGYVSSSNIEKLTDDHGIFNAYSYENKIWWGKAVRFSARYFADGFPTGSGNGTSLLGEKTYYPKSATNEIYDLVTTLYNEYTDLQKNIKPGYVYAYSYANSYVNFAKYITSIDWDSTNNRWSFKHNGTEVTNSGASNKFTIFYSDSSYLNIVNNSDYPLTITSLTIWMTASKSYDAVTDGFGYVTAIDNVNLPKLRAITAADLSIPADGSIKLLFPGAKGRAWNLAGSFDFGGALNPSVVYSLNGGEEQTLTTSAVGLSGNLLTESAGIYEILFGDPISICKVGEKPFPKLTDAMDYIQSEAYGSNTATIEMLIDYQQPKDDILTIPKGYDITLTTAEPLPADPEDAEEGKLYYVGEDPTHATISRSSGEVGSAVKALIDETETTTAASELDTKLTVTGLIFDGKALGQGGEGGAINTTNVDVKVSGCIFKGYTAARGGAIYTKWGKLDVRDSTFNNCRVFANEDKTGGGGVWTTAQILTVDNCVFTDCYGQGQAQGSAIFHNIRNDGAVVHPSDSQTFPTGFSKGSETYISNCQFKNCTAIGSGGTIESDAWIVEITNCCFNGSQTLKSGGNGGAINIYTNDNKNIPTTGSLKISGCTFLDCSAPNGTTNGGAIRTLSPILIVENSTFTNVHSNSVGGAISMSAVGSSIKITDSAFNGCTAGGNSGAVYANAKALEITNTTFKDCTAPSYGCIYQTRSDNGSSVTVNNSSFENCISSNSQGGAIYTVAKTLSVSGVFGGLTHNYLDETQTAAIQSYPAQNFTFKNCTATTDGGAVYHGSGTSDTLTNCVFDTCSSGMRGGGAFLAAGTISVSGGAVNNCKAETSGGALYISPTTGTISNCGFTRNWVTASDGKGGSLFINQGNVTMSSCNISNSKATYGGGIYKSTNHTLTLNLTSISDCYASYGGGIYHTGVMNMNSGSVSGCKASRGGGIYSAAALNMTGTGSPTVISACYARDVALKDNGAEPDVADNANAENLGGGIYNSAGAITINSTGAQITGCNAYDGGGVYLADGSLAFSGGSIDHNAASNNGGGICQAVGSVSLTAEAADISISANTAAKGAGLFVADGLTLTANGQNSHKIEISDNEAYTLGGGIAVGGASAALNLAGYILVQDNTQGSAKERCNIYLDQDTNSVIRTSNALDASSYIGVYVVDDLVSAHGEPGLPFGTWANSTNLNAFRNDRAPYYPYYYGTVGASNNQIVWSKFVCKITGYNPTTGKWEMLFTAPTEAADTGLPAVYPKLEGSDTGSAFGTLNVSGTPSLYLVGSSSAYNNAAGYRIEMLVQDYSLPDQASLTNNKTITLTTASTEPDECGFKYDGLQNHPYATITRSKNNSRMLSCSKGKLTLSGIILDGGSNQGYKTNLAGGIVFLSGSAQLTIGSNATLRNSRSSGQAGAGVRVGNSVSDTTKLILEEGGLITNCTGASYGGGVSLKAGTFEMTGGSITDCSAQYGGGVRVDRTMIMSGGTITGNSTTANNGDGGGISFNSDNGTVAKVYFSGNPVIKGNTFSNGDPCDVQLTLNSNEVIFSNGLEEGAEIGVYTPGLESNPDSQYSLHGLEGMPFGTWTSDSHLYCFFNDRNDLIAGMKPSDDPSKTDYCIYWLGKPMIEINLTVVSDWTEDLTSDFALTVKLEGYQDYVSSAELVSFGFNSAGERTIRLKNGEKIEVSLPVKLLGQQTRVNYTVTEAVDQNYFSTTVENRRTIDPIGPTPGASIGGYLGENVSSQSTESTSTSKIFFVTSRDTDDVTFSKEVVSDVTEDMTKAYRFTLTMAGEINEEKTYTCVDADGQTITEGLTFTDRVAEFTLQHGQSITVQGLPRGVSYTVAEEFSGPSEAKFIQTRISKNGSESSEAAHSATGKIGEHELRSVKFINIKRDVVCKITNSDGELLYYTDTGEEVEAIFYRVEDAFAQVNSGGLHTGGGASAYGVLHIEMVVPEYAMEGPATLNSGRTVLLTTADTTAPDGNYPYQGTGPAVISRGFTDGSMINASGNLTLDNITLDGGADEGFTGNCDGGIIHVNNSRLTVESGATLQNSDVGANNGGAIWCGEGSYITMRGTIDGCSARNGGGIYAGNKLSGLTVNGTLSNNTASVNGGAICAESAAASSVNVNLYSATLSGNHANNNGGAVYSQLNVIVRNTTETVSTLSNNSASGNGGAIYMGVILDDPATGEDESYEPTFNMSSGVISGNSARNGGALVIQGVSRISGGSLIGNTATNNGGAIFTTSTANLTISGSGTSFSENSAARGGVVYDQGTVTMSAGSMTGNEAATAGSAVYVGGGHSFTMSGGSITGNNSPAGAVSSDPTDNTTHPATLTFSGNAVIHENTSPNLTQGYYMDVYLGLDSDLLIHTPGLGSGADIGIYVANGEDNNILYEHGIANCNFGTYNGTNPENAGLEHFFNDRYPELYGVDGRLEIEGVEGAYFVMWKGKDLRLVVHQFDVQTNEKGEPLKDAGGHYIPIENSAENAIAEASFRLVNITDWANVEVWTGKSDSEGKLTVPWGKIEENNHATFLRRNTYKLEQLSTNDESLLPGGYWTITVARDGTITWTSVKDGENPNRVKDMGRIPATEDERITLDDEFIVYNDRYPKIIFNANGGRMQSEDKAESVTIKMDEVTDTSKDYTITESNPTWNTKFLDWEDKDPKSEGDEAHYKRLDEIKAERFYRTSDFDDLLLYANWETIVCKITDRDDNLLYLNGDPCIYHTLEEAFDVFNATSRYQTSSGAYSRYPGRKIQMLVDSYELTRPLTLNRSKTLVLTTATSETPPDEHDVYLYYGESWPCTITRGFGGGSMIQNYFNLTLSHITLDGGGNDYAVTADGGIVNVDGNYAQVILVDGATLQNSVTSGLGGAIYAADNPTVNITVLGGDVLNNSASQGGGIYLSAGTTLAISGGPNFGGSGVKDDGTLDASIGNFATGVTLAADAENGGTAYTRARQDIYIAGYAGQDASSLYVSGSITSGDGAIWVWAAESPHYKTLEQFAKYTDAVSDIETTMKAFRNARPDTDTDASQVGEYLYGIVMSDDRDYNVSWYGIEGTREVVIRKVSTTYDGLAGAVFDVYKGESDKCYESQDGFVFENLVSEEHGIIWVGPLPYGVYYLHEKQSPPAYSGNPDEGNLWFYFVVSESEVTMSTDYYVGREAAKVAFQNRG